jgi:hypothetical protein
MIKKILKRNKIETYQRDPPMKEDSRFEKYMKKEIAFYRNLAIYGTANPTKEQKNGLENTLS